MGYLRDYGLLDRKIDHYFGTIFLKCISKDDQTKVEPADLSDVFTIGLALLIGMLIALLAFAMEILFSNYSRHRMIYDNDNLRRTSKEWSYYNYYEYVMATYHYNFDKFKV